MATKQWQHNTFRNPSSRKTAAGDWVSNTARNPSTRMDAPVPLDDPDQSDTRTPDGRKRA